MEQTSIREVAAWSGGLYEGPDLPIAGVSIDSRKIEHGQLFIPLRGARQDGHAFLGEAFVSGAAAALVDQPSAAAVHAGMGRPVIRVEDTRVALGRLAAGYRRSLDITVVGITGSNGKTTTKEMLKLVLGARAVASPRSFNNEIGVPLTLLRANRSHAVCVVEMGTNGPGEIAALAALARPDVGVVLNVGESHLQGLLDLDGVTAEKLALVESLPSDGCAVLNWDDPATRSMMEHSPGYAMSFGTWPDADVFGGDVRARGRKLSFRLLNRKRVSLDVLGVHNVHNALAAAAVAMWLGEDPVAVCERLKAFRAAPMRMAVEDVGRVRLINDAYNANPRSVAAALAEISYRGASRRVAVLGDMLELGKSARTLHAELGRQVAERKIDVLWAIGPLSESTAKAARAAGMREVFWSESVTEAIESPLVAPKSRDVVLFKASRGVRLERVYDAVKSGLLRRRRPGAARARS